MADNTDILAQAFNRFLTGFTLSKAILEDYAKVVAKLENVPEQVVIDRVQNRSKEIFNGVKEEQLKEANDVRQKISDERKMNDAL